MGSQSLWQKNLYSQGKIIHNLISKDPKSDDRKSLRILYQKDSVPHAMTLMKDIEFMIGLFIPDPASIKKTSLSCERTLYCM